MQRCYRKMWDKLKNNSQGAALLMVLLVTVFVILAGSSVMFTSYNGYVMKLMEREGAKTFYTTEEIMDLVRVEYQEAASSALQDAYTRVMAEYSYIVAQEKEEAAIQTEAQNRFNQYFIEELDKYEVTTASGTTTKIFSVYDSGNLATHVENGTVKGNYYTEAVGDQLPSGVGYTDKFTTTQFGTAFGTELSGDGGMTGTNGETPTDSDGTFNFEYGDNGYPRLVLKDITVSHVSDSGYQTNITTDIVIEMPMFTHTGEINTGSEGNDPGNGLPFDNVATLGKYWVKVSKQTTDESEILVKGDVYGGVFFTYNENFGGNYAQNSNLIKFSHSGRTVDGKVQPGRLITFNGTILAEDANDSFTTGTLVDRFRTDNLGREIHEGVEVYDGTNFIMAPSTELWTKSVYVDAGSNAELDGITYIEGDITLDGGESRLTGSGGSYLQHYTASRLTLGGTVVMFGNGNTAEDSSAIIIDGPDVVLDFSALNKLYIAGTSYLSPGRLTDSDAGNATAYYDLGQSISTLPDQIAYLIPPAALSNSTYGNINSNPIMVENTTSLFTNTDVLTSYVLWNGKTIGDYALGTPKIISRTYGDSILYYFFYDFNENSEKQSNYLKDYVANNDGFQTNLELFVDLDDSEGSFTSGLITAGSFYYLDSKGDLQITEPEHEFKLDSESLSNKQAEWYQDQYAVIAITLWEDQTPTNREIVRLKDGVMDGYHNDPNINALYATINPYALQADWETMQEEIQAEVDELEGKVAAGLLKISDSDFLERKEIETTYWIREAYREIELDEKGERQEDFREDAVTVNNPLDYYVNIEKLQNDVKMLYEEFLVDSDGVPAYKSDKTDEFLGIFPTGSTLTTTGRAPTTTALNQLHMYFYFDSDVDRKYPVALYGGTGVDYQVGGVTTDAYDATISTTNLSMLLAANGINIHSDYKGLAMSQTGIAVIAPIESDPDRVQEAIYAKNDFGIELKDYLRNLNFETEGGGNLETPGTSSNNAEVNWAPNDLVYYENWEKH